MAKFKVGDRVKLEDKEGSITEVSGIEPVHYSVNLDDEEGVRGCVAEDDLKHAKVKDLPEPFEEPEETVEPEEPATKVRRSHRKKE